MPSALNKLQKRISKKRSATKGKSDSLRALHENSRDAQRIRRAAARDEKVVRQERDRERRNDRFLKRLAHIHAAVRLADLQRSRDDEMLDDAGSPWTAEAMHTLVVDILESHSRGLKDHERERRSGRPKTREHEKAEAERHAEESEYDSGLWMVDLTNGETLKKFRYWEGRWEGLGHLSFVRVRRRVGDEDWGETIKISKFPPTGGA